MLGNYFRSNITATVIVIAVLGAIFAVYQSYKDTDELMKHMIDKGFTQEQINSHFNPMEEQARIVSLMIEQKYSVDEINEYRSPSDDEEAIIMMLAKNGFSPAELSCFANPVTNSAPADRIRFCSRVHDKMTSQKIEQRPLLAEEQ